MRNTLVSSTLLCMLLNSQTMADELDIKLVDESEKSALFQKNIEGSIVGCYDNALKKELACSKKPKDAILSKLPSSKQIEETNLDDDNEREQIKMQLANILAELNSLKKAQKADRNIIKELKSVIADLAPKSALPKTQQMPQIQSEQLTKVIQDKIEQITPKKSRSKRATIIRKKIKEIYRTEDSVVIEVQRNESLSTYAEAYYGDNRKYYRIFQANKHILPPSMILTIGEQLTIPLD